MAVNDTWIRTRGILVISSFSADVSVADIPLNDTLLRVHAGFELVVQVPGNVDYSVISSSHYAAGLYTTLTTGGTVLNPTSNQADQAPPLQRWLWWEQLVPRPAPVSSNPLPDYRREWRYVPAQNPIDVKSQVKATTAISLHLALGVTAIPQAAKSQHLWYWLSVLRSGT